MQDLSDGKITGTKDSAFRFVTGLLYEAVSGQPDADFRHPNVDAIDRTMSVLRTRRDDSNATPGDVVCALLRALHLAFDCRANGL
jgi:hypothetical protein